MKKYILLLLCLFFSISLQAISDDESYTDTDESGLFNIFIDGSTIQVTLQNRTMSLETFIQHVGDSIDWSTTNINKLSTDMDENTKIRKAMLVAIGRHEDNITRLRAPYITFAKQGTAYIVSRKIGLVRKGIEKTLSLLPETMADDKGVQLLKNAAAEIDLAATSAFMEGLSLDLHATSGVPFNGEAAWRAGRNGAYILILAAAARKYLPEEYTTNWSEPQKAFAYAMAHVVLSACLS